jgi:hypothetical protein
VALTSENYPEMLQQGLLVRAEYGEQIGMRFVEDSMFYDATNPRARQYVWKKIKQNYAWLCFRALRLGAGWPGALELPVGLLYDMIAAEQIYSGAANEKPRLSYAEAMALK